MKILTIRFGELDVPDEEIFTTIEPIPGFPQTKRYFFIETEKIQPFKWLQSVEEDYLTFVVVEPSKFFSDYEPIVSKDDLEKLALKSKEEGKCFAIVVLPDDLTQMTANLRAPLLFNLEKRIFKQVFLETDKYTVRESILEGIKRSESKKLEKGK